MAEFSLEQFLIYNVAVTFVGLWRSFLFILLNGGWILFAAFLLWLQFYRKWFAREEAFLASIDWIYLNVAIPELANPSIMSAEQMFAQLHATKQKLKWREKWVLAKAPTWFSFELVSLGGVTRYIVRSPRVHVENVKSAIFAQYPHAEISEVGDYMEALKLPFNPSEADYDIWGTELTLEKKDLYPIKTYPNFEHRNAETILDPLAALLEVMANLEAHEMIAVQIACMPTDDAWKEATLKEVKKLKGAPPVGAIDKPPSLMQHLTEKEKNVIVAVQNKLSKLTFLCKIRIIYAAPKDKIEASMRSPAILGAFAEYAGYDINAFKANKAITTKIDVRLTERYEALMIQSFLTWKKRALLTHYKKRMIGKGGMPYHLDTEELASLFHFPLEEVRKTSIEKIDARKAEPPVNLPI